MTPRYIRTRDADRRFAWGDDFAGDAWWDTKEHAYKYVSVGFDPNDGDQP